MRINVLHLIVLGAILWGVWYLYQRKMKNNS